ncbi:MAG: polysaccharide deacetylase family protein [Stellaceae bacterium]
MIPAPRDARPNGAQWSDLLGEFDRWGEAGRAATLWWRDDDAAAPDDRLNRLLALAGEVPVTLAVIPAQAEPDLAAWLAERAPRAGVVQHGWRHANHALDRHKSEFPAERPPAAVEAELGAGHAWLSALFGARARPVLAPPWNRFATAFLPLLAGCGIAAISGLGPRRAAPGVGEVNVHVDLIAWREGRAFIGEAAALSGILAHLRARRQGLVDVAEPTGLLTHHAVQDAEAAAFLSTLVTRVAAHGAARWLAADEVFAAFGGGA